MNTHSQYPVCRETEPDRLEMGHKSVVPSHNYSVPAFGIGLNSFLKTIQLSVHPAKISGSVAFIFSAQARNMRLK